MEEIEDLEKKIEKMSSKERIIFLSNLFNKKVEEFKKK